MDLIVTRFGNVPVLAEKAAHVAARGAHAEDARTGQEMIKRLLFDGVNTEAARPAVAGEHDLVVLAGPHEADASLALAELHQNNNNEGARAFTELVVDNVAWRTNTR